MVFMAGFGPNENNFGQFVVMLAANDRFDRWEQVSARFGGQQIFRTLRKGSGPPIMTGDRAADLDTGDQTFGEQ